MSGYMSRLFPKSNSSLLLQSGTALKSTVHRLRDDKYLVDSGIAAPKLCLRDALTLVPSDKSVSTFHNKVGFMGPAGAETEVNRSFLERYFIDIVAGDDTAKATATARVFDLIGSVDESGSADEPLLLLPRKYRQKQALMELNKLWRQNKKVNGFILEKVRGGYLVAIGGYIAFLKFRPLINQKILSSCSFTISSIGYIGKRPDILVF
uniref:Ribosomal protein S1 n=1 Tax=Kalanchoe fedtschenkoi TaxID=63787 RepID=A0A7N0UA00_KALFE